MGMETENACLRVWLRDMTGLDKIHHRLHIELIHICVLCVKELGFGETRIRLGKI